MTDSADRRLHRTPAGARPHTRRPDTGARWQGRYRRPKGAAGPSPHLTPANTSNSHLRGAHRATKAGMPSASSRSRNMWASHGSRKVVTVVNIAGTLAHASAALECAIRNAPVGVQPPARLLHRMRRVEHHRVAGRRHDRQRAHVGDQRVVAEGGAALGQQDLVVAGRRRSWRRRSSCPRARGTGPS